jgi:hypothetical protein
MARFSLVLLRWAIKGRDEVESLWSSHKFGMWIVFVGLATTAALLWRLPAPGIAVAIMGIAAALMAARKEPTAWEKAAWTFMMFGLLLVEILAVRRDRKEHDKQLADLFQQGTSIKSQAETNFGTIEQRIEAEISNSGLQFRQTIDKENAVLDTTQNVATLAQESLDTVSGKGSYPCIFPQSHAVFPDGSIPMTIWDQGPNVLTGVAVILMTREELLDGASLYKQPSDLGTVRPEWPKTLPERVRPVPDNDGVAHYLAMIYTQNGYYTEVINFRRGKYLLPWAYQFWLTQQIPFRPKGSRRANGMIGKITKACTQGQWSDDLGDGKPAPKPPS